MLSSSIRIRRGFSRIGIALAALFLAVAGAFGIGVALENWIGINRAYEQAQCIVAWQKRLAGSGPTASSQEARRKDGPVVQPNKSRPGLFDDLIPSNRPERPLSEWSDAELLAVIQRGSPRLRADEIGCDGPMYELDLIRAQYLVSDAKQTQRIDMAKAAAMVAFGVVAVGFVIWLVCYGIGWALSGFAKD
jgi:hypothetical protein